jgi:hypothetical protein
MSESDVGSVLRREICAHTLAAQQALPTTICVFVKFDAPHCAIYRKYTIYCARSLEKSSPVFKDILRPFQSYCIVSNFAFFDDTP